MIACITLGRGKESGHWPRSSNSGKSAAGRKEVIQRMVFALLVL